MNRKGDFTVNLKNMSRMAALALCALLCLVPMGALAAETTALAAVAQGNPTVCGEQLPVFGKDRGRLGVTASDQWLWQARIGGMLINLRLFTPQGEAVTFQENLGKASDNVNNIRLEIRASRWEEDLILQLDQRAMNALHRTGITEIVVCDSEMYVRAVYKVSELQDIRDHFGLAKGEQLCVSGENNPVTVVSEDGIRRQITQ